MINDRIDDLGRRIAESAMRTFVLLVPAGRALSSQEIAAAVAAMRAASEPALDRLLADVRECPELTHIALITYSLDVAHAGLRAVGIAARASKPAPRSPAQ